MTDLNYRSITGERLGTTRYCRCGGEGEGGPCGLCKEKLCSNCSFCCCESHGRLCPNCAGYCDRCDGPICPDEVFVLTQCACCYVVKVGCTYMCKNCVKGGNDEICSLCELTCICSRRRGTRPIPHGVLRVGTSLEREIGGIRMMWSGFACNEEIEVADNYKKNKAFKSWRLWSDMRSFVPDGNGYNRTKKHALKFMKE